MNIMSLINALPGASAQGLIWGIMAIGVYLTFRILDVADLTVDGTMCTGGAVCVMMLMSGHNIWVSMLAATGAGMLAGLATGIFHDPCRNPDTAWSLLCQPQDHGQSKPGSQRKQIQPSCFPSKCQKCSILSEYNSDRCNLYRCSDRDPVLVLRY